MRTRINLAQLENYYDIPMENGDRTGVNVVLEPQDNTGGSTITDPVDTTPLDNDNSDDGNDDADTSGDSYKCPPNCILGEDIEDAQRKNLLCLVPKRCLQSSLLLLVAIGLITRNTEEDEQIDADQTVIIERME